MSQISNIKLIKKINGLGFSNTHIAEEIDYNQAHLCSVLNGNRPLSAKLKRNLLKFIELKTNQLQNK